jgi:ligand-binding sensor domain-containing protein
VDQKGQIWAVANGNIVHYPDEQPVRIPLPDLNDQFLSDSVQSLAIDGQNRPWLGTVNGLIIIREINGWRFYAPTSIEGPRIGSFILFDNHGQAWTNGGELARIDISSERTTYALTDSGFADVDTMTVDASGQLWVLSTEGELRSLKPEGNWITHGNAIKEDPATEWAFTPYGPARLMIDGNNMVWIGAGNGILQGQGQDGSFQIYRPDEPHPAIYTDRIVMDGQGGIWGVSGYQGMYRFHPMTGWVAYNAPNSGMSNATATTLAVDGQGRVWIGTLGGGIRRFDPAAALPGHYVAFIGTLGTVVVPAALLGVITAILLKIPLARTISKDRKFRNIPETAFTVFSAAIFTLYTFGQRDYFTDRFMYTVFGDGWGFADVLMFVVPGIRLSLIPLSTILGAAVGILVYRVLGRAFGK